MREGPAPYRRVMVTGMGIVSSLGNDLSTVLTSLQEGRSGIHFDASYREAGLRSHVVGGIDIDLDAHIDRKDKRFMGGASAFTYIAMRQAIADAGLSPEEVSHPRTGLIMGTGGGSPENLIASADLLRSRGVRRVGAYMVPRTMCSSVAASLATATRIQGTAYSVTSACATSAHCIGSAMEHIRAGRQDIMFAGGGEEDHWSIGMLFDAMGALSCKYNDTPEVASRPYDVDRDGFVVAAGGGVIVLEELEHACARGARIFGELVGYGATSDGADMVVPSGEGAVRCMRQALSGVDGGVDYVNAHGTSTPVGDLVELRAIGEVFGDEMPPVSSTKSLSGHALGAAGVHEAIYSLLMLQHDFIAASANVFSLDPKAEGMPIVTERRDQVGLSRVMSNNFGFGGTNASLVFQQYRKGGVR